MYIIKSKNNKVFLITANANCKTLGVNCNTCDKENESDAYKALEEIS